MNKRVKRLGLVFDNPLLPASGPLTEGIDNLLELNTLPLGGLVTKTISVEGAKVQKPCIAATRHMVFNTELWSEHGLDYWVSHLPRLIANKSKPLGISVGYTLEDLEKLIPVLGPFADFFEVSTHYNRSTLETLVKGVTALTTKPVLIKMSPHGEDDLHFVETVMTCGAAGVVAFNSFGPGLLLDLKNRSLLLGNAEGNAWVSGPAIKPFALKRIAAIRSAYPDVPIIGCGGVETAKDLLEMILAGADLVQMVSTALMNGRNHYEHIVEHMGKVMKDHQIISVDELRYGGLNLRVSGAGGYPKISDVCTGCQKCVKVCPFGAYKPGKPPVLNTDKCIRCGLCESSCLVAAIEGVLS